MYKVFCFRFLNMELLFCIFAAILQVLVSDTHAIEVATELPRNVEKILNETRRIINGEEVIDSRPYMVYLKMPRTSKKAPNYRTWLCGGAIIHEEYILTSAACIEDAEHFYIVSGTYKYNDEDDRYNNPCIKNGAKKAIWKCIPKNYAFDGHENDNIRWMNNDIAVVKIEEGFDFTRRVKGCDFIPRPICYNNQSQTLENPGTLVTIAGWGTTSRYNDWVNRRKENQQNLLEAHVEIIPKNRCKRRWGARYHNIIDNYMICTKDIGQTMSEICNEKYVDCTDINYSDEDDNMRRDAHAIKSEKIPTNLVMHSAYNDSHHHHSDLEMAMGNGTLSLTPRRAGGSIPDGGFCENDHGGPLVYGTGLNAMVIGVISACLVKERSNKCYGPFLYTSVYKNRQFISCAIYKEVEPKCRRQFRSGVTHVETFMSWKNHPDGPAKHEIDPPPVKQEEPILPPAVPVAFNAPAPYNSPQSYNAPQSYKAPETYNVPKPHDAPKSYIAPEPYNAPKPYNPPQLQPYIAPIPPPVVPQIVQRAHEDVRKANDASDKVFSGSGFILRAVNDTLSADINATNVTN